MNRPQVRVLLLQAGWLGITLILVLSQHGFLRRAIALVVSWIVFTAIYVVGLRRGWLAPTSAGNGQFRQPGNYRVVLQVCGANAGAVVLELRQTTGRSLAEAREIVGRPPVIIASGVSQASADAVVARLTAAGARAVANPMEENS